MPARRMPQRPSPKFPNLRSNHGPAHKLTLEPKANSAITTAPCHTWLDKAATINAEYSKPHGIKAQSTPTMAGAAIPQR